jgi:hypothetical protein
VFGFNNFVRFFPSLFTNENLVKHDRWKLKFIKRFSSQTRQLSFMRLLLQESRKSLLTLALKEIPLDDGVDLDKIAALLNNYSGADVTALCRDAALVLISTMNCSLKLDRLKMKIYS